MNDLTNILLGGIAALLVLISVTLLQIRDALRERPSEPKKP